MTSSTVSYEDLTQATEFEEVGSSTADFAPTHDFDINDTLIGTFQGSRSVETKNGDRTIHSFLVEGFGEVDAWGAAIMNSRLDKVAVGTLVKIVKTGRELGTKNGRRAKEFLVYQAVGS